MHFDVIVTGTGIKTSKVTHHRAAASQLSGFEGFQINTMTKHKLDKQHTSYQSEAEREVQHACFSVVCVTNANSDSHRSEDVLRHVWPSERRASLCPLHSDRATASGSVVLLQQAPAGFGELALPGKRPRWRQIRMLREIIVPHFTVLCGSAGPG
jgi:hypothetical protein